MSQSDLRPAAPPEPGLRSHHRVDDTPHDGMAESESIGRHEASTLEQAMGFLERLIGTTDYRDAVKPLLPLIQAARRYHRHEVHGLNHIPLKGRTLIVVNHSLATYDIILLMTAIYSDLGRLPRPLLDRLFFKIPYVCDLMHLLGAKEGSHGNAETLLLEDHIVTVAPGGMREALRPASERYQIRWEGRLGFVRLAMRTRSPVVLAACPAADDLYEVYPSHVTEWFYQNFRVPIFLARGLGPTWWPRPIKLIHELSEPIMPPAWDDDEEVCDERARAFHAQLVARMERLMRDACHRNAK